MQPRTAPFRPDRGLAELQKAEAKIKAELVIEKGHQLVAHKNVIEKSNELKILREKNPAPLIANQKKALQLAQESLTESKKKLVIGAVEMVAISASLAALAMLGLASADLFSLLLNYKIEAMLTLSSVVGSSGYLGWIADKKAALTTRIAQDHVKASQNELNKCQISCEDHKKAIQQTKNELAKAQQELAKITANIEQLNKKAQEVQAQIKIPTQQKMANSQHIVFSNSISQAPALDDAPTQKSLLRIQ